MIESVNERREQDTDRKSCKPLLLAAAKPTTMRTMVTLGAFNVRRLHTLTATNDKFYSKKLRRICLEDRLL